MSAAGTDLHRGSPLGGGRRAGALRLARKGVDVLYMARDFARHVRGRDYFRQPDRLGRFFVDGRSYYIDFTGKTRWTGLRRDGLPMLYVPSLGRAVSFPGMILQYGLGSIDMWFATGDAAYQAAVGHVAAWIFAETADRDCFDNLARELGRADIDYHSNNSAMTQGEAISFLRRVAEFDLMSEGPARATEVSHRLYRNMLLPLETGGSALYEGNDLYLCEYCRTDGYVVLNGWVFAIYGLVDYCALTGDVAARARLETTLDTLERALPGYLAADGWSYYDNKGRLCSPVYHTGHIHQLDALFRLTRRPALRDARDRLASADDRLRRLKYTVKKVAEKLRDPQRYTTSR